MLYEVKKEIFPKSCYVGMRETVDFSKLPDFYHRIYSGLMENTCTDNSSFKGFPVGLYFGWNMEENNCDVYAGIHIDNFSIKHNFEEITIEERDAYYVDYYGPYDKSMEAYQTLMKYFKENNLEMDYPAIEEYITDPVAEPDQSKWHTKIYLFVK